MFSRKKKELTEQERRFIYERIRIQNKFSGDLRWLLRQRGVENGEQFAKYLGVNLSRAYDILEGRGVTLVTLASLAVALDVRFEVKLVENESEEASE